MPGALAASFVWMKLRGMNVLFPLVMSPEIRAMPPD
jgi:hypothetical protein